MCCGREMQTSLKGGDQTEGGGGEVNSEYMSCRLDLEGYIPVLFWLFFAVCHSEAKEQSPCKALWQNLLLP